MFSFISRWKKSGQKKIKNAVMVNISDAANPIMRDTKGFECI
jgi:hypothetical protein